MPSKKKYGGGQPEVCIDLDDSFTPLVVSVDVPKVKKEPPDIGPKRESSPRKSPRLQQVFTDEDEEEASSDGDFLSSSDEYQPESEEEYLESGSDLWEESDDSEPQEIKVEMDIGQVCLEKGDKVMYPTKSRKSIKTPEIAKKSRLSEKMTASCKMSLRSSGLRTRSNKVYASELTRCKKLMKKKKTRLHESLQQNESDEHSTNVSPVEIDVSQSMEQDCRNKSPVNVQISENFVPKEKVADASIVYNLRKKSVNVQNSISSVQRNNMFDESVKIAVRTSPCIKSLQYNENITIILQRPGIKSETKTRCMYCGRNVWKLAEHLQCRHFREMGVVEMNKYGKNTLKRRQKLQQMIDEGLRRHNDEVLQTGEGTIIPVQTPVNIEGLTSEQFCTTCYTFTDKNFLDIHRLHCSRQTPEEINFKLVNDVSDDEMTEEEEEDSRCGSLEISEAMIKTVNEKLKQVPRNGQITVVDEKQHNGGLMCAFCLIVPCHFSRHLQKKHSNEPIVRDTLKHPKGSAERKQGWTDIRNSFCFLHNKAVLERGRGELLVQNTRGYRDASQMEVCQFCYGLYRVLQSHLKRCQKKLLLSPSPKKETLCECMSMSDKTKSGRGGSRQNGSANNQTNDEMTIQESTEPSNNAGDSGNKIKWQTRWNGKKKLLKQNCCFYCKQLKIKMYRHFEEKHSTESEVQRALKYSKQSKEKREVFSNLIFKGNNEHNKRIFQLGRGTLIPPRKLQGMTDGPFSHCPVCFSRVRRDNMWMHKKRRCQQKLSSSQKVDEHKSANRKRSISSPMKDRCKNRGASNTAQVDRKDSSLNGEEDTNLMTPSEEKNLSSRQVEESGSSRQVEESGSSRQVEESGSNRQVEESGSSGQLEESGSSRQVEESGSSRQVEESGSNRQVEESGSNRQMEESGSSGQLEESGSSRQVEESGCSRQVEESGSSRQVEESGSSRQVEESGNSRQVEDSGSSRQVGRRQGEVEDCSVLKVGYETGGTERRNCPGFSKAREEENDLSHGEDDVEKAPTELLNIDSDKNIVMVKKKNKDHPYSLKHNENISILLSLKHSFCLYCQQPKSNIIKHLENKHCEEELVEEAIRMPREFEAGKKLWNDLIVLGNKKHNDRVIQAGCGDLVPLRRVQKAANISRDYEFCFTCYLFIRKTDTVHKFFCEASRQTFDDTEEENLRISTANIKEKCFCKSKSQARSTTEQDENRTQNYQISNDGAFNFNQNEKFGRGVKLQKRNCCVYCQTLVVNMSRHLKHIHSDKMEVQRALDYPLNSLKRRQLFKALLRRGNYQHNRRVAHLGSGFLIPVKLRYHKVGDLGKYTHCDVCFGLYTRCSLSKHKRLHREHQVNGHLNSQPSSVDDKSATRQNSHRAVREKVSVQKHNNEMSDESDQEWDIVDYRRLQRARNKRLQKCKRSHEEDQTHDGATGVKRKRKARKGATLWSEEELTAVTEHFSDHIKKLKVPGKEQCLAAKEKYVEALRKRDWKSIKFCVYNKIQTQRKQGKMGKVVAKSTNKQPWNQLEVCAVEKNMHKFITNCETPGKLDCLRVKRRCSSALQNRTWQQIKYYVYNRVLQIRKMKK
ncbi:uncharacterized protein LOC133195202 [Saccostrea echinata]|uniref:uncharacterized protein LOC133195202 n=1 Tax=Saccostrea echinata TaxID=191078 RepID=UPI002A817FF3|nr:uncharacterized protein LOC133195202 [Saccostrea echinata]